MMPGWRGGCAWTAAIAVAALASDSAAAPTTLADTVQLGDATVWYVDQDNESCPGDGSDVNPFCTIQEAFDEPTLGPGDCIRVREAATTYAGATVVGDPSGLSGEPIILEPDAGQSPVIADAIGIQNVAHWTVRGLTFDGAGADVVDPAIWVSAFSTGNGIEIANNTILNWVSPIVDEGRAISVSSSNPDTEPAALVDPFVHDNRIIGTREAGIRVRHATAPRIENNEIAGVRCGVEGTTVVQFGIRLHEAPDARIARNWIHDFDASVCEAAEDPRIAGIYAQEARRTRVNHNLVSGIVSVDPDDGMGIRAHNNADDIVIDHNIVFDTKECAICNTAAERPAIVANTVVRPGEYGIDLSNGTDFTVIGNLVLGGTIAQIRLGPDVGPITTIDHNLYWDEDGGDRVGRFAWETVLNFADWRNDCACDQNAINADPELPVANDDFTVASQSPAVDAGVVVAGQLDDFHGAAPDVGALESPLALSARIEADDPGAILLELENAVATPLRLDGPCAGFTVTVDGNPSSLDDCVKSTETLVELRLSVPAYVGEQVELSYDATTVHDSVNVGGTVDARLQAFAFTVTNESQEEDPTTSSGPSSSGNDGTDGPTTGADTEGTESEGDGSAGGNRGDESGCACRSDTPARAPLIMGLLLVIRRRRPPITNVRSPMR